MAQWNKNTQDYLNQEKTLHEVMMIADRYGNIGSLGGGTYDVGGRTAFGEISTAQVNPLFQLDGLYGITDDNDFQLNSALSGSQSVDSAGLMTVSSGTTAGAFATLRSKRSVRYRPGQGSMARFTAMFPTGHTAGYQQVAGYLNQSDLIGVGYNFPSAKTEFAVVRRYNGKGEVYKVAVTAGASGAETFRITLDGTDFDVTVTSGTAAHNASELAAATYTQWIVDVVGTNVYFLYNGPPGDLTGSFAVANQTGSGTMAATGTTIQEGLAPTDKWTYQSDFNLDKLDGTGSSGMTIDPTKLNVFQIDFRWLGVGLIRYCIEDQITGELIAFHMEHFVNQNTTTHLANPSMRVGYGVVNVAGGALGTGTDVIIKGGSMMGAIQGILNKNTTSKAVQNSASNLTSNDTHHILTLKSDRINENGTINKLNQREVVLQTLALGVLANAGNVAIIDVYKNADLVDDEDGSPPNDVAFAYTVASDGVSKSITTANRKANSGTLVTSFVVASNSTANIDLNQYRIILAPLERISIFVTCAAQVSPSVALTYQVE